MSVKDRSTLLSEIATNIADNTSNDITALDVRTRLQDIVDSYPTLTDDSHLLSLRTYDPTKTYLAGFSCVYAGNIYVANTTTTCAFAVADWNQLTFDYIELGTVGFADIQTAGLTNDVLVYSLPAGHEIKDIWRRVTTPFAGTGITNLNMTFGVASDNSKYGFSFDMLSSGFTPSSNRGIESDSVATELRGYFTAVGANLDQLTAGEVKIYATIKKVF